MTDPSIRHHLLEVVSRHHFDTFLDDPFLALVILVKIGSLMMFISHLYYMILRMFLLLMNFKISETVYFAQSLTNLISLRIAWNHTIDHNDRYAIACILISNLTLLLMTI